MPKGHFKRPKGHFERPKGRFERPKRHFDKLGGTRLQCSAYHLIRLACVKVVLPIFGNFCMVQQGCVRVRLLLVPLPFVRFGPAANNISSDNSSNNSNSCNAYFSPQLPGKNRPAGTAATATTTPATGSDCPS